MDNPWSKQISTRSSLHLLSDGVSGLWALLRLDVDEERLMGVDRDGFDNGMARFLSNVT